jgi:rhodanese-related sulfurtransferase
MRLALQRQAGVVAWVGFLTLACSGGAPIDGGTGASLGAISPAALHEALQNKDFLLVNVHVPNEGEIPGTDRHIPYTDTDALAQYIGPDLGRKVVVYCMSNYMSTIAGNSLVGRGYRAIRYLDGGMGGWRAAGYPLN